MALTLPGTTWDPLGPQTEPRMRAHDVVCLHTMVGTLAGTSNYFHQNGYGGTESHIGMGGNGTALQWQDLFFQADANNEGNARVISIETADRNEGYFPPWSHSDVPYWTNEQVDKIVFLLDILCSKEFHIACPDTWECHKSGIPRTLVPDSRKESRGIAYHRQGIDPWRDSLGESWSTAYAKVCPGDRRIDQLINIIIPRLNETEDNDVIKATYVRHVSGPQVYLAGLAMDPRPVTFFKDAEYHADREGIVILDPPADASEDIQDGADTVRKVMVVNDGSLFKVPIPTGGSGGDQDLTPVLDAIKQIPKDTVSAIKTAL